MQNYDILKTRQSIPGAEGNFIDRLRPGNARSAFPLGKVKKNQTLFFSKGEKRRSEQHCARFYEK